MSLNRAMRRKMLKDKVPPAEIQKQAFNNVKRDLENKATNSLASDISEQMTKTRKSTAIKFSNAVIKTLCEDLGFGKTRINRTVRSIYDNYRKLEAGEIKASELIKIYDKIGLEYSLEE